MWKNIKGFTLIELMICIMILAIMAIMGVTVMGNVMAWKSASNNSNAVIVQQQDEQIKSTVDDNSDTFEKESRY